MESTGAARGPFCPGNCISGFLRFACFGENAVHPGLRCPQEGLVCCAPVAQVQRMALAAAEHAQSAQQPQQQQPQQQPQRVPEPVEIPLPTHATTVAPPTTTRE